ncbi:glucose 1-dehydrogenase [Conexibacter stalactiti]|uniref:SDR family oxidoreductase n=1 Tax=Conexibacter stalactiti TaxID=1940611 RepID=A0ABU4HUP5_9ACTN|nr:glucose 1-dehydrogenase [Conexibacter stalactiti]MDW5596549.1 SDR family oxidoreductase [Conexibacter stalactiti]MEC5037191.1 glucose 1-dehydrogenase [Conexibacter stalactiti]
MSGASDAKAGASDANRGASGAKDGASDADRGASAANHRALAGRVALVTGAGRGIGRAIACALAQAGADVALSARTQAQLDAVAEEIRARHGVRAIALPADVTDATAVDALMAEVGERLGGLDVLVNNAGGARSVGGVEQLSADRVLRGIELNLLSVHHTLRAAAPLLLARPGTAVAINVVSIAASRGLERMGYYSAAKAGVVGLSRSAAREWGPRGVRVVCLAPGWVETDLTGALREDEAFVRETTRQIPLGRWAAPEDVAGAAVFLASDAARYVTGTTLHVDGGMLA